MIHSTVSFSHRLLNAEPCAHSCSGENRKPVTSAWNANAGQNAGPGNVAQHSHPPRPIAA